MTVLYFYPMRAPTPDASTASEKYLNLRRGIRYETQWVEWCEEAIAAFQSQG